MRQSSGQSHSPPDGERDNHEERPFNPSQLLWRIWLLFRRRPRLFQRVEESAKPPPKARQKQQPARQGSSRLAVIALQLLPVWILLLVILIAAPSLPLRLLEAAASWLLEITRTERIIGEIVHLAPEPELEPELAVSPLFTQEVEYWADQIINWSVTYQIPPDFIATVMQIESCGDPTVSSSAGASGLFQVMPFHFEPGQEYLNPDTNAQAGLTFLAHLMELSEGDVAKTLAGYNGGASLINVAPEYWPDETRRYVYWGTGIYADVVSGLPESPRLNEWLAAGGYALCQRAAATLGLEVTPFPPTSVPTPGKIQ